MGAIGGAGSLSDGEAAVTYFDSNGDGLGDGIMEDHTGDGIADTYGWDSDGNGTFDTVAQDINEDGVLDGYGWDTNADNVLDVVAQDTNQNGMFELVGQDANFDGTFDIAVADGNENGINDLNETTAFVGGTNGSYGDGFGLGETTVGPATGQGGPLDTNWGGGVSYGTGDSGEDDTYVDPNNDGDPYTGLPYSERTYDSNDNGTPDFYDPDPS
jgi:hypothetical protein